MRGPPPVHWLPGQLQARDPHTAQTASAEGSPQGLMGIQGPSQPWSQQELHSPQGGMHSLGRAGTQSSGSGRPLSLSQGSLGPAEPYSNSHDCQPEAGSFLTGPGPAPAGVGAGWKEERSRVTEENVSSKTFPFGNAAPVPHVPLSVTGRRPTSPLAQSPWPIIGAVVCAAHPISSRALQGSRALVAP